MAFRCEQFAGETEDEIRQHDCRGADSKRSRNFEVAGWRLHREHAFGGEVLTALKFDSPGHLRVMAKDLRCVFRARVDAHIPRREESKDSEVFVTGCKLAEK